MPMLRLAFAAFLAFATQALAADLVTTESAHDVTTTVDRLAGIMEKNGITVFARVDHAAGAAGIGESLPAMEVIIFGNPKLGTPLMQANPEIGLDLPLKVLVWDAGGTTTIGYLAPDDLKARYGIEGRDKVFETMTGALAKMTGAAAAE